MPAAAKIAALFEQLTRADVDAMPPAERQRFAALCRHWGHVAEPREEPPKVGVLGELQQNGRQG
jgi:hypothetical protein